MKEITVTLPEEHKDKIGKPLVEDALRPEVEKFSEVFRKQSGSHLTLMEKEILIFYLYHKVTN